MNLTDNILIIGGFFAALVIIFYVFIVLWMAAVLVYDKIRGDRS